MRQKYYTVINLHKHTVVGGNHIKTMFYSDMDYVKLNICVVQSIFRSDVGLRLEICSRYGNGVCSEPCASRFGNMC